MHRHSIRGYYAQRFAQVGGGRGLSGLIPRDAMPNSAERSFSPDPHLAGVGFKY